MHEDYVQVGDGIVNRKTPCLRILNEGDCVQGGDGISNGQTPYLRILCEGFGAGYLF